MNRLFLVCAGLAGAPSALAQGPTWDGIQAASWAHVSDRQHDDAGDVAVYSATVAGVECFQGRATVSLPPQALLEVVTDVESTTDWSTAGLRESELLARNGDRLDYYQFLDVPGWTMASDRFWFVRGEVSRGEDRSQLVWDRLEEGGEHRERWESVKASDPSAIEPPVNVGGWVFERSDQGTRVIYNICSDTGGSLPSMIQSAATTKTLPDTVGDLVREAKERSE